MEMSARPAAIIKRHAKLRARLLARSGVTLLIARYAGWFDSGRNLDNCRFGPLSCSVSAVGVAHPVWGSSRMGRKTGLAKAARPVRRRGKLTPKDMKFRNDPIVHLYERAHEWLQDRGRPFFMVAGIAGLALVLCVAVYYLFSYRTSKAENALAAAMEKYNAQVTDTPPANSTAKYYTDEKLKWQESAEAFEKLSQDYSTSYGVLGRYYAGTAYLHFDPAKGLQMLEEVAGKNKPPTSDLARLALAENYAATGDSAKAIDYYKKALSSSFVPKAVVQLGLGHAYEKTGDKQDAVDAYFAVAEADRSSSAGTEAEKRLTALAPDKLKDLPAPNTPGS
jgi:tetratricopeptide (TPR) repeat protein